MTAGDRHIEVGWGAYGLRFDLPALRSSLVEVPDAWPMVEIVRRIGRTTAEGNEIDPTRAVFELHPAGSLEVSAPRRRAVITATSPISDAELVHPYLAPIGASFAWWAGHEAFHAGGFAVDGRAWAVLGEKGRGKSTLLGWLALQGHEIVCDDMLVVAGGMALAGPRCLDLRQPAAEHLGTGELVLRSPEQRWRVALDALPPSRPLGGWIFLGAGDRVEAAPLAPRTLLPRLAAHRSMSLPARDPKVLLDLAALPAWDLRVPQEWGELPRAADQALRLVADG